MSLLCVPSSSEPNTSLWGRGAVDLTPGHSLTAWKGGKSRKCSLCCPLLPLQLLLGRTDASLRMRKLWQFLPELCRHSLLHKPCANLLFLLGGYNEKNLNMVRVCPCRALAPTVPSLPQPLAPSALQQALHGQHESLC